MRTFDGSKAASGKREGHFLNLTFEVPHPEHDTSPLRDQQEGRC